MLGIKRAAITICSRQDGEETVEQLQGEVFTKGSTVYIKYEQSVAEPKEGVTRTMIKISDNELKIMRHGMVQSEQTFQQGQRLPGFYRSPFMSFNLSTKTDHLVVKLEETRGDVEWGYDLYVYDDFSGHFSISLHIQEEL